MAIQFGLLRTRVARRILLLFVLSALLPAAVLSVVSYRQVRDQLLSQSRTRLTQVSKSAGMAVYERLLFVQSQLELLRSETDPVAAAATLPGLNAVAFADGSGHQTAVWGQLAPVAPLTDREASQLRSGEGVLRVRTVEGSDRPEILLGVTATAGARGGPMIWGRVEPVFLWSSAQGYAGLSTTAWFCVVYYVDEEGRPLICDAREPKQILEQLAEARQGRRGPLTLEWTDTAGYSYLAGAWQIFLDAAFHADSWDVLVAEDKAAFLAPLVSFRMPFMATVVFALTVVALLSNIQIRRNLEPLEKLSDATRRITEKDFDARVDVTSGDEFEELAESFNSMARSLNAQFGALAAIAEIDRAILSQLDRGRIVTTVLERVQGVFPADHVAVILDEPEDPGHGWLYASEGDRRTAWAEAVAMAPLTAAVADADLAVHALDRASGELRQAVGSHDDIVAVVIVPFWLHGEHAGYMVLGHREPPSYSEDDLSRLQQIADQVSVALSNADLLDELEHLTWGALTALARAIDAKSPWTAGHSERVTALAVRIAGGLGLDEATLETLRRGGLLHDIGKIGIPGEILDKQGPLTEEEARVMASHTRLGARILEPIPALEGAIPVVLSHHERYDGKGYPDGLAGEDIPFLARVLAVADVYDALTSDRPYRKGLAGTEALNRIVESSGSHFDPHIVDTLVAILHAEARASA